MKRISSTVSTRPTAQAYPRNVVSLHPARIAEAELEWFFTMAESDMGLRSNYMEMLVLLRHREPVGDALERHVEAVAAHRTVLRRLSGTRGGAPCHAGILQAAFAARPWALGLREHLGRATGVAVRLATAEVGLPDDDRKLDALERRTADRLADALQRRGPRELEPLRRRAQALYAAAFAAYERVRGDGPCVMGRWS
jgi:hypothetical protein